MIRCGGLFCARAKGYSSFCQNIRYRTSSKLLSELGFVKLKITDDCTPGSRQNLVNKTKYKTRTLVEIQELRELERDQSLLKPLTVSQSIEILKYLMLKNIRSIKLLKELSEKICLSTSELTLKMCSDLLYCSAKLSFKDLVLLDKIADNILSQNVSESAGWMLPSMIQSIGVLKYRNCDLIEFLLKHILTGNTQRQTENMLKSLLTMAIVNFNSPYAKLIINELNKCSRTDFCETRSYLDFVWACILLNEFSPDHVSYVLSPSYINILSLIDGQANGSWISNMKLQNISAAATFLMPEYKGPTLIKPISKPTFTNSKSQFLTIVMDGLSNLFPKNEYFKTIKDTNAGFILDVECCIDSEGKPVPLYKMKEYGKTAIILLDYNDFCLDKESTVTGLVSFKQKILKAKGYKVTTISYFEYNNDLQLSKKIQCLENKFKNICKNGLEQSEKS